MLLHGKFSQPLLFDFFIVDETDFSHFGAFFKDFKTLLHLCRVLVLFALMLLLESLGFKGDAVL